MQRTVVLTVRTTLADAEKLSRTAAAFGAVCDWISGVADAERIRRAVPLHHRTYYEARGQFAPIQAQFVVRAIGVVADTYRREPGKRHRFRTDGAVVYDARLLRFEPKTAGEESRSYKRVSLSTVDGRIVCELGAGCYQRAVLAQASRIGECDLLRDHKGRWRLHVSVTLPDPAPVSTDGGVLGVDVGLVNLAVDSDGNQYSGAHVNGLRRRYHRLRRRLQAKGTHSARRRLRSWRHKQARFQRDVNHVVAKRLVTTALLSNRALAVEDLDGISRRLAGKVSRDQRRLLGGWGFFQLRSFVQHKAEAAGVAVLVVDPRYTSQTCPACGHTDRRNRLDRATFRCVSCPFAGDADHVAALNISRRGMVSAGLFVTQPHGSHRPPASGGVGPSCRA